MLFARSDRPIISDGYAIVRPGDAPAEQFNTCETGVRKPTEPLGRTEMHITRVIVEPGQVTTPHTHGGREEVFVPMNGGHISTDGEVHDVPSGGVVRAGAGPEPA